MILKFKTDELLELYNLPVEELIEISSKVTRENFGNVVEFCSIISAKTGKCSENCKYCAQSSHYRTNIETHSLISIDEAIKATLQARENGVTRFALVTSGTKPTKNEFDEILKMIEAIAGIDGITCCGSFGILNGDDVIRLKNAGLTRYNHNLNTSKSYYSDICSTHKYEDRVNTVKLCKANGIEACSGCIIGMGETRKQRVELALELADLDPVSVPVNFLDPIAGTPFENYHNMIDADEILKTLAIFRIALPKAYIRYAGGRASRFPKEYQKLGLKAGVNAIMVGNFLTTNGISPSDDMELINKNRMTLVK